MADFSKKNYHATSVSITKWRNQHHVLNACQSFLNRVKAQLKKITKPTTATLTVGAMSDLARNKNNLIVENAMLRQQLIVLKRSVKRPKLTNGVRVRLSLLARLTDFWHSALHIVQPETLLRWHRDLFRWYWRRKSEAKSNQPRIPQETIDLIRQMAQENPLWKAKKIQGELLKLGIKLHKHTIRKYMKQVRRRTSKIGKLSSRITPGKYGPATSLSSTPFSSSLYMCWCS